MTLFASSSGSLRNLCQQRIVSIDSHKDYGLYRSDPRFDLNKGLPPYRNIQDREQFDKTSLFQTTRSVKAFPARLHGIVYLHNSVCQTSPTLPTSLTLVHLPSKQRPHKRQNNNSHLASWMNPEQVHVGILFVSQRHPLLGSPPRQSHHTSNLDSV